MPRKGKVGYRAINQAQKGCMQQRRLVNNARPHMSKGFDEEPGSENLDHEVSQSNVTVSNEPFTVIQGSSEKTTSCNSENKAKPRSSFVIPSNHKEFSNAADTELGHYSLITPSSMVGEIQIDVLDLSSTILKQQFSQKYGLLPPYVYAHIMEGKPLKECFIVPKTQNAVQIHYVNSHYVVSHQFMNSLTVYDSSPYIGRLEQVLPQLQLLYKSLSSEPSYEICYCSPQHQGSTSLCGAFAVAFTVTLLERQIPMATTKFKMSFMRSHLQTCIENYIFTSFPCERLQYKSTDKASLLTNYFSSQADLQKQHKETQFKKLKQLSAQTKSTKYKQNKMLNTKGPRTEFMFDLSEGVTAGNKRKTSPCKNTTGSVDGSKEQKIRVTKQKQDHKTGIMNCLASPPKDRKKLQSQQRYKKCREKKSDIKKALDRLTDRERKRKVRLKRTQQEIQTDACVDRIRKRVEKLKRTKDQTETNAAVDKARKRNKRLKRTEQEIQTDAVIDKVRKRVERLKRTEQELEIHAVIDKARKRVERLKKTVKEIASDAAFDRKRKREKRLTRTEQEIEIDAVIDKARKKVERLKRTEQEKEIDAVIDKTRKRDERMKRTEQEIQNDAAVDRARKRNEKLNRTAEEFESIRYIHRERKRSKRILPESVQSAVTEFKNVIQEGPTYICTSCNRLLFRRCVLKFSSQCFGDDNQVLVSKCRTAKVSFDEVEYICSTCRNALKRGQIPAISVENGLGLDEVPQQLVDLTPLEVTFISRRIPFMKLLGLPRGKQKAIHGCVVNIPVEPERSVAVLPRVPCPDSVVCVKLKRKLQYRGHVMKQNIRPQKIRDALYTLKHGIRNPLYEDVIINEDWENNSRETDQGLWDSLTSEATDANVEDQGEQSCTESEEETKEDVTQEDEKSKITGLPFDSCLQPKAVTSGHNVLLNIAPGEGKKPQAFETDEHSEELSFPHLFPTGKFGYSMERNTKLSLKRYFQSRILNCDGRFSKNIEYIFYAQYRSEAKEVADQLSIALRKGKKTEITAGDLKNKVDNLIRNDLGIHFLQNIRGSPAFFNKMLYDLLGMIRQLGPCTWFITLSAADLKWKDTIRLIAAQQCQILSDQDIENLTWEQKCAWLRTNPVTAARHFDHRINLFLKCILLNKNINPLGEITDYKYRVEFQQRGSPHVHMLAWVKDAPSFEMNTEQEIEEFIDRYVSCSLPDNDQYLRELLLLVQKHTHSSACRKHGQACRFHFPHLPARKTMALRPLEEEVPSAIQEIYKETLAAVHEVLDTFESENEMSIDSLLEKAGVSEDLYIKAIRWIKTKSGRPAIILKRTTSEIFINNYSEPIMLSWEANHDVQFVTSVLECVFYVASYVSKPEKTLGDLLKAVSKAGQHLGAKASMKTVAKKFLSHREVSAQEAVYRLLSLPLTKSSRPVVFIPTDLPENRTCLFKPIKLIQLLEDDDPDVFQTSILDRYEARPDLLENMCLADFVANYTYSAKTHKEDTSSDNESDRENEQEQILPKHIQLKKGLGQMMQRMKTAVVRSHQFSELNEPDKYYHAQLLLYYPWRHEIPDLLAGTYKDSFYSKQHILEENRSRFDHHTEEVNEAVNNLVENGLPEDSWGNVAPQTEQMRGDEAIEGARPDEDNVLQAYDTAFTDERQAARDLRLVPHEYDLTTENLSSREWYEMVLSLNEEQSRVHEFIVSWCTDMILAHRIQRPPPFHIFLTGGAGVGKSHLVRTLVQTVIQIFSRNDQCDVKHIMVCAPTGAAAYNISGYTLHAAFLLPLNQTRYDDYIHLSSEKLAALKEAIGDLKIIIIDEVSMVGSDMLLTIHRRLSDVMGNQEPFGGISVLAVGDLLQLPPVGQKSVFSPPSDEVAAIYGSLWQTHFQIVELTQIVRQQNDGRFAALLNRVRVGEQTAEDIEVLKSRQSAPDGEAYPKDCTHIFAYNKHVDHHNKAVLQSLTVPLYTFEAKDSKRDTQTGRVEVATFPVTSGGLAKEVTVAVNARVMLTQNIDVSDGLVNSATGYVTGFLPSPPTQDKDTYIPKYIYVRFDEDRVGHKCRNVNKGILNNPMSTPIPAVENQVRLGRFSKVTAKRKQFPLTLAWAVTIHKEQGKTESNLVISCQGSFQPGQFYTAISRTKTLDGLFIIGEFEAKKIKTNVKSKQEIIRMKKEANFNIPIPTSVSSNPDYFLKFGFLNTNSLVAHRRSLETDYKLFSCHLVCLVETWLIPSDLTPEVEDHYYIRRDHSGPRTAHRSGGLLVYIHHDFHLMKEYVVHAINIEYQIILLSPRWNPEVRFCVILVYKNPKVTAAQFLPQMEKILSAAPVQAVPTIILGDLNIDYLSQQTSTIDLKCLMTHYGFVQYVEKPTHRKGALLDHLYYNRHSSDVVIDVSAVYYSDHLEITAAVPYPTLHQN